MVSGRTGELDRLIGLEVGADDYLVKPFSMRELQARVAALFRRPAQRDASPPRPAPVRRRPPAAPVLDPEAWSGATTCASTPMPARCASPARRST